MTATGSNDLDHTPTQKTGSLAPCPKCDSPILDGTSVFRVKNEVYHQSCLTCHICHDILTSKIFFSLDGKFYCDSDFSSVAVRCTICDNPIRERIIETSQNHYHPECFRCTQCLKPMDGEPYTTDATGNIYCIEDFHKKYAPKCHLCKEPIVPKRFESETSRIVALDRSYHPECYRCVDCKSDLMHPEVLCYWVDTGFYCKECRDIKMELHIQNSLMTIK